MTLLSMNYSVVFFGTHEFATTILSGLLASPDFSVVLVITQPDRPVGRKQIMTPPPVKLLAESKNIPVLQPESLKNFELPTINQPDFGITAQYGNLIPPAILNWPKLGMINTHTSLLPKYRGASPVQAAILNGDTKTGITIMLMEAGLDTGPILLQETITIEPDDRAPDVEKKLAQIAIPNLVTAVRGLAAHTLTPQPQDSRLASTCGKLDRDMGQIDWDKTTAEIYNTFRALYPWPGIWTSWAGKRLKLLEIKPGAKKIEAGKVLVENQQLSIGTADASIEIITLQLEGKSATATKDFLAGYQKINDALLE